MRNTNPAGYSSLTLGNNVAESAGGIWVNGSNQVGYGGVNAFNLISLTSAPIAIGTDNTVYMRIVSGGNVGISAHAPAYKLDVGGTSPALRLQPYTGTPIFASGLHWTDSSNRPRWSDGTTGWELARKTAGEFTQNNIPFIGSSGELAQSSSLQWIDTPARKLHVAGEVRITGSVDTATVETLGAFNPEGDLRKIILGSGLSFSGGELTLAGGDSHMANTDLTLSDNRIHVLDGHYWLLQGNLNNIMSPDSSYFGNSGGGQPSMSVSNTTGFFLAGNDASSWLKLDAVDGSADLTNEYTGYGLKIADDLAVADATPDVEIGDIQGSGPKISFDNDTPSITLSGGEVYMPDINPWGGGAVYNIVQNPTTKEIRYDSLQSSAYGLLYNGTMDSLVTTSHTDLKMLKGWQTIGLNSGHFTFTDTSAIYTGPTCILKVSLNVNYYAASAGYVSFQIGHAVASGTSQFIVTNGQTARKTASVSPVEGEYHTEIAFQVVTGYEIKFKGAATDGVKVLDGGVIFQQLNFMD